MINKGFIWLSMLLNTYGAFGQINKITSEKIRKVYYIDKYDSISVKKIIVDEKLSCGMYFFEIYRDNEVIKKDYFVKIDNKLLFKNNDFKSVKIFRKNYKPQLEKIFTPTKIEEMDSILRFVVKPPKF